MVSVAVAVFLCGGEMAVQVLAWSAIPLGSLVGGDAINRSGSVAAVNTGCGVQVTLASLYALGPPGHADKHIAFAAPGM